jgi:hypothetical protein
MESAILVLILMNNHPATRRKKKIGSTISMIRELVFMHRPPATAL